MEGECEYAVVLMVTENRRADNLTHITLAESLDLGKFSSLAEAIDYMCVAYKVIERMHQ